MNLRFGLVSIFGVALALSLVPPKSQADLDFGGHSEAFYADCSHLNCSPGSRMILHCTNPQPGANNGLGDRAVSVCENSSFQFSILSCMKTGAGDVIATGPVKLGEGYGSPDSIWYNVDQEWRKPDDMVFYGDVGGQSVLMRVSREGTPASYRWDYNNAA